MTSTSSAVRKEWWLVFLGALTWALSHLSTGAPLLGVLGGRVSWWLLGGAVTLWVDLILHCSRAR